MLDWKLLRNTKCGKQDTPPSHVFCFRFQSRVVTIFQATVFPAPTMVFIAAANQRLLSPPLCDTRLWIIVIYRIVRLTVPLNCGVWLFYRIQNQKILLFVFIQDFCSSPIPPTWTQEILQQLSLLSFCRNCACTLCRRSENTAILAHCALNLLNVWYYWLTFTQGGTESERVVTGVVHPPTQ